MLEMGAWTHRSGQLASILPSAQVAGEKQDNADQQDETEPAAADERTTEVKSAAAKQEDQDQ
jgi:hypothetical protein